MVSRGQTAKKQENDPPNLLSKQSFCRDAFFVSFVNNIFLKLVNDDR